MLQLDTLHWELNGNKEEREYILNAALEFAKCDITRIIYDITYLEKDYSCLFELIQLIDRKEDEITYILLHVDMIINIVNEVWEKFENFRIIVCDFNYLNETTINKIEYLIGLGKNVEIEIIVNSYIYKELDENIKKLYEIGVRIICIKTQRFGEKRLCGKEMFSVVKNINSLSYRLEDLCIYVTSPMKYVLHINEHTKDARDIRDIFIDKNGYIGTYNFLPTYFEHIKNGAIYGWSRYIALYLKQDIEFTLTRQGMIDNYESIQDTIKDRFKYGFYNVAIPHIVKCFQIKRDYIIDIRTGEQKKINQMAFEILDLIAKEKNKSMLEIANKFISTESREITGEGYADIFNFLRQLWDKKIIYIEWRNILLDESTTY